MMWESHSLSPFSPLLVRDSLGCVKNFAECWTLSPSWFLNRCAGTPILSTKSSSTLVFTPLLITLDPPFPPLLSGLCHSKVLCTDALSATANRIEDLKYNVIPRSHQCCVMWNEFWASMHAGKFLIAWPKFPPDTNTTLCNESPPVIFSAYMFLLNLQQCIACKSDQGVTDNFPLQNSPWSILKMHLWMRLHTATKGKSALLSTKHLWQLHLTLLANRFRSKFQNGCTM